MSNLTLPRMTYVTLNAMLLNAEYKGRYGTLKLAYETTVERYPGGASLVVRHHGNPIAEIGPDYFTLSGAGWNSRTTADRLNAILRDNQTALPTEPGATDRLWYSVSSRNSQRDYGLYLFGRGQDGKVQKLDDIQHGSVHFSRVDSDHHYVLHGE